MQLMYMHVTERPPLLCDVRPDLVFSQAMMMVVNKALSKDPNDRQQSMEQLWDEFDWASRNEGASQSGAYRRLSMPTQTQETTRFPAVSNDEDGMSRRNLEKLPVAFRADTQSSTNSAQNIGPYAIVAAVGIIIGIFILFTVVGSGKSTHWLVTHGKYEEALYQLKSKQLKEELNKEELDDLNATYFALATKVAKSGRYEQAISYLQQISPKAKQAQQAKRLLRKYKQHINN
jgi:hypothetical protein